MGGNLEDDSVEGDDETIQCQQPSVSAGGVTTEIGERHPVLSTAMAKERPDLRTHVSQEGSRQR